MADLGPGLEKMRAPGLDMVVELYGCWHSGFEAWHPVMQPEPLDSAHYPATPLSDKIEGSDDLVIGICGPEKHIIKSCVGVHLHSLL